MKSVSLLLLSCMVFAQTPVFEVADVHVSKAGMMTDNQFANGRLELRGFSMLHLITYAYGVDKETVIGGPEWLDKDRFDVLAQGAQATPENAAKLMLRALLADRFKLAFQTEDKPMPAYVLTVEKKSLLKEPSGSGDGGCESKADPRWLTMECENVSMAVFANRVHQWAGGYLDHPVVDRTGLKGGYDFTLRWTARSALAATPDGLSIFDAVEKELGLKLEAKKQPLTAMMIEGVNRKPTPNPPGAAKAFPPTPTEFEVAVIKPSKPDAQMNGRMQSNGRFDFQAISLKLLIQLAYDNTDNNSLIGAPKWLDSEHFDIVAKASRAVPVDSLRVMVKSLLADRFKLVVHTEDRPIPIYALVVGKRGPKLEPATGSERAGCKLSVDDSIRIYTCKNTTMEQLAQDLRNRSRAYIDHPVVNVTGLMGAYNFTLSWTNRVGLQGGPPPQVASDPTGGLTVFEAIDRQLGLKLEVQKKPMPVLVIDHVNQVPTEN
jgi:uncharacterized protein (TIGR03435 family)